MNVEAKTRPESRNRIFHKGDSLQELILDPKTAVRRYAENNMASNDHSAQHASENPRQDLSNLVSNYSQEKGRRERFSSGFPPSSSHNPGGSISTSPPVPLAASFSSNGPPLPYRPSRPSTPEVRLIGPAPPKPEVEMTGFPAPRLYHRMVTEYETIRTIFYLARTQPSHNDLSPIAAKLKFLSREIWNLRYNRAAEFPYSEAVTEERITEWKVQYDYWADVLEDLLDPRYVARTELEKSEEDWAGVAGLASVPGTVGIARKKVTLADPLDDSQDQEDEEVGPVSILKKKKAVGSKDTPKKKKVPKKASE